MMSRMSGCFTGSRSVVEHIATATAFVQTRRSDHQVGTTLHCRDKPFQQQERPLSGNLFRSVPLGSACTRETLACRSRHRRLVRNTIACRGPWFSPRTASGCSINPGSGSVLCTSPRAHSSSCREVRQSSPPSCSSVFQNRKTASQSSEECSL